MPAVGGSAPAPVQMPAEAGTATAGTPALGRMQATSRYQGKEVNPKATSRKSGT